MDGRGVTRAVGMLIAVAAGCRGAAADGAQPARADLRAAIGVPAAWTALPRVVAAATKAMNQGAKAAAWGDAAAGCYVVIVSATAEGDGDDARDALMKGLGAAPGKATAGAIEAEVRAKGVKGKARGWVTGGRVVSATAAACVGNDREPEACAKACDAVWAKLVASPVIP